MGASLTTYPAATITDSHGNTTALDERAYDAVKAVLRAIGLAPSADEPADPRLTTGQAAEILGYSSRTVARLVDNGLLPGSRAGAGHRYLLLSDVMEYKRAADERHRHLQEARDAAEEEGLYSEEYGAAVAEYLKRFE